MKIIKNKENVYIDYCFYTKLIVEVIVEKDIISVYIRDDDLLRKIIINSGNKWYPDDWEIITQDSKLGAFTFKEKSLNIV